MTTRELYEALQEIGLISEDIPFAHITNAQLKGLQEISYEYESGMAEQIREELREEVEDNMRDELIESANESIRQEAYEKSIKAIERLM